MCVSETNAHTHNNIRLLLSYHTQREVLEKGREGKGKKGWMKGGIIILASINHLIEILIIVLNRKS